MKRIDPDHTLVQSHSKSNFLSVFSQQPECLRKNVRSIKGFKKNVYDSGASQINKTNTKSISNFEKHLDQFSVKSPQNEPKINQVQSKKSIESNVIDFFSAKQNASTKPPNYYLLQMKPKRKIQYFDESQNSYDAPQDECMSINIIQRGSQGIPAAAKELPSRDDEKLIASSRASVSFVYSVETCQKTT